MSHRRPPPRVAPDRALAIGGRAAGAACILVVLGLGACGGGRDVVPETHDTRGAGGPAQDPQGYEYVARRPLSLVALAEARGIAPDVARRAVDQLADALDTCVTLRGRTGAHVDGAARLVAAVDDDGSVGRPNVRIDPGDGVAESAVVCLVAPARLLVFPAADAGARGIAIEALWGRIVPPP
jgi:hypothetical protein